MKRLARQRRRRSISAITRVDQAKPISGKRACRVKGKMTPPMLPPAAARPVAWPRLRRKKCPIAEMEGVNTNEVPRPPRMPKTMRKCQYFWQMPRRSWEAIRRTDPAKMRWRGPQASKMGPIWIPAKKERKA